MEVVGIAVVAEGKIGVELCPIEENLVLQCNGKLALVVAFPNRQVKSSAVTGALKR
jgi:hypothetical protein